MNTLAPNVTVIPPKPELENAVQIKRQLRVAAYCRVSTDEEEQLTSYEAQKTYYTDKIMTNPDWTLAGIFADEGITGTSANKRPAFLRMIRQCRQKKIDIVLTKSISRFARNTLDCLRYIRELRVLGIAVIFEKENIDTLRADTEMLITLLGAFAQAESESISANVRWGKQQAMREGRVGIQYSRLYAYERGEDGKPKIIPEQAEVVRGIYDRFLAGASLRMIKDWLEGEHIPTVTGKPGWTVTTVRGILTNEKYCGDVLLQKTYLNNCIDKKPIKNTGSRPMYLIRNHHEGIVSRDTFNAARAEMARRKAEKSHSDKAPTGLTAYTSRYALSERLVCGECGTLYRRCTWARNGNRRVVWRCVSRLDYGIKYCHNSPTLDEGPLQRAILTAINKAMSQKSNLTQLVADAMVQELVPTSDEGMSLGDIARRMEQIEQETHTILVRAAQEGSCDAYTERLKALVDETADLKERRAEIEQQRRENTEAARRIQSAAAAMAQAPAALTTWDETVIRQLVHAVRVLSAEKLEVTLNDGQTLEQAMGM